MTLPPTPLQRHSANRYPQARILRPPARRAALCAPARHPPPLGLAMDRSRSAQSLQRVSNFRDVGETVNRFLGLRLVREGLLFRSARPDGATPEDEVILRDEIRIRTIVDLRTDTELRQQARKQQAGADGGPPSWFQSITSWPGPRRIEGIDYREIKITGRSFERHLLTKLAWWNFFKVIFLAILGYRLRAARIIVHQVLVPIGLLGIGTVTLDHSGADVREALSLFTNPHSMPALVHCTLGKDRTGLVCALILMILRVPIAAIEHDYFLTDAALPSDRTERLTDMREAGFSDEWASTAKHMITGMQRHLTTKYGGIDAYLDSIGFHEADRAKLREALLY